MAAASAEMTTGTGLALITNSTTTPSADEPEDDHGGDARG